MLGNGCTSALEVEAGRSLNLRPAYSIEQVPGWPGLYTEKPVFKTQNQTNQPTNQKKQNTLICICSESEKCDVVGENMEIGSLMHSGWDEETLE